MASIMRSVGTMAVIGLAASAFATTAEAKHHRGHHAHHAAKPALLPAHLKPTYVGAPGYPGGAPGPRQPGLIDVAPATVGLFPGAPLFKGVPVLDQIGL